MNDTWRNKRLAKLAQTYGQRGVRLLVLFETLKNLVRPELHKMHIEIDETELNTLCLKKADELLLAQKEVTLEDISGLLEKVRIRELDRLRR